VNYWHCLLWHNTTLDLTNTNRGDCSTCCTRLLSPCTCGVQWRTIAMPRIPVGSRVMREGVMTSHAKSIYMSARLWLIWWLTRAAHVCCLLHTVRHARAIRGEICYFQEKKTLFLVVSLFLSLLFNFFILSPFWPFLTSYPLFISSLTSENMNYFRHLVGVLGRETGPS
jgi:hypothetical protein